MQVEGDVKCMQANFGGHSLSDFRDLATFQIWPNFHGGQKIESAQNIQASRG